MMNDEIHNLLNSYENSNFNFSLSNELSNESYDIISNSIYNLHMNIMNNLNEELNVEYNILEYHNYLIENLRRRLLILRRLSRLSENIGSTNPSLHNLHVQRYALNELRNQILRFSENLGRHILRRSENSNNLQIQIYVINELRNQISRFSENLNNNNDSNLNNRLFTDNIYTQGNLHDHVNNNSNDLRAHILRPLWYDDWINENDNNEGNDNDNKEINLSEDNKIDEGNIDKENKIVYEGECPICRDVKNLESKFKCKHSVCIECLHGQLGSNVNLVCCICRSEVDNKKLRKKEKKMIDDRSNIEAPRLSSSFGLLNLVAFGSVNYSFDDDES